MMERYGTIQVSGPAIAASRDNVGAFVQALESEVDGLQRDTAHEMNRLMHSDGLGAYGYWTGADDTSGTDIDDNRGNGFTTLPLGKTMTCDLLNADNAYAVIGDSMIVTRGATTATNTAVTWSAANPSGSADGDVLVREDSCVGGVGRYPVGIAAIIDDADPPALSGGLQGVAISGHDWWKAQVFDAAGVNRPLAFEDMQEVIDAIAINSTYTEKDIGLILMNYPLRRAYYKLCIAERRHINTMTLDGGWRALDFNGMPLMVDAQCRRNRMYFINFDTLGFLQTADWDWMDKDGSYLYRDSTTDAYKATLFMYGNLCTYARNGNGLLDDIIEE